MSDKLSKSTDNSSDAASMPEAMSDPVAMNDYASCARTLSEFVQTHMKQLDSTGDGTLDRDEIRAGYSANRETNRHVSALLENYKGLSEQDGFLDWGEKTISITDMELLVERADKYQSARDKSVDQVDFIEKHFNVLSGGDKWISREDMKTNAKKLPYDQQIKADEIRRSGFSSLTSAGDLELVPSVTQKDLAQHKYTIADDLVVGIAVSSKATTEWTNWSRQNELNKVEAQAKTIFGEGKHIFRQLGNALVDGDLDSLSRAVASIKSHEDAQTMADELNTVFPEREPLPNDYGYYNYYRMKTEARERDYRFDKPTGALIVKFGDYELRVPTSGDLKPKAFKNNLECGAEETLQRIAVNIRRTPIIGYIESSKKLVRIYEP